MNKARNKNQTFEEMLNESLRFHGMLTPAKRDESKTNLILPENLQKPDFLHTKEKEKIRPAKMRLAAFKNAKKRK